MRPGVKRVTSACLSHRILCATRSRFLDFGPELRSILKANDGGLSKSPPTLIAVVSGYEFDREQACVATPGLHTDRERQEILTVCIESCPRNIPCWIVRILGLDLSK